MDRSKVREIKSDLQTMLEEVAQLHGLEVEITGGRYDNNSYSPKVKFYAPGAKAEDFEENTWRIAGMEPDDFGKVFSWKGKEYRITGLKPNSPKYPVMAERVKDGRSYKFTADLVVKALGRDTSVTFNG